MIATLTTDSINKPTNALYNNSMGQHANQADNMKHIDLNINEKGQITLPEWLLKAWDVQSGSKITLITREEKKQPTEDVSKESKKQLHSVKQFDENRQLSVAELMQSVGVTTNKKATVEEMNASVANFFKNWEG